MVGRGPATPSLSEGKGGQPDDPGGSVPRERGINGLAVASLVCGLIPLPGIFAIIPIVLGVVAKQQINRTNESGNGMATAGIVLGVTWLVLSMVLLLYLVFVLLPTQGTLVPPVPGLG